LEERFFLGLRRREGISLSRLDAEFAGAALTGSTTQKYAQPIREFRDAGLLEAEGDRLRLTDRGVLFSNEVFAGFLEEN
jgi:oxygen-independent coproporphyrinogen-3 oxidase